MGLLIFEMFIEVNPAKLILFLSFAVILAIVTNQSLIVRVGLESWLLLFLHFSHVKTCSL